MKVPHIFLYLPQINPTRLNKRLHQPVEIGEFTTVIITVFSICPVDQVGIDKKGLDTDFSRSKVVLGIVANHQAMPCFELKAVKKILKISLLRLTIAGIFVTCNKIERIILKTRPCQASLDHGRRKDRVRGQNDRDAKSKTVIEQRSDMINGRNMSGQAMQRLFKPELETFFEQTRGYRKMPFDHRQVSLPVGPLGIAFSQQGMNGLTSHAAESFCRNIIDKLSRQVFKIGRDELLHLNLQQRPVQIKEQPLQFRSELFHLTPALKIQPSTALKTRANILHAKVLDLSRSPR